MSLNKKSCFLKFSNWFLSLNKITIFWSLNLISCLVLSSSGSNKKHIAALYTESV